jgi:uncharacterized protein (DUF433 family)
MGEARIISDPAIAFGKPIIAGTRIAVELILEELAAGESIDNILENHPHLTREQVVAALDYAKRAVQTARNLDSPDDEHAPQA